jgi:hypothetical protein
LLAQVATNKISTDGSDILQRTTAVLNALEDPKISEALNTFADPELDSKEHETTVETIMEQGTKRCIPDSIMDRELSQQKHISMRETGSIKSSFTRIREATVKLQAQIL